MHARVTDVFSIREPRDPSLPVGTRLLADNAAIRRLQLTPGCEVLVRRQDGTNVSCILLQVEERWGQLAIVIEGTDWGRFRAGDIVSAGGKSKTE